MSRFVALLGVAGLLVAGTAASAAPVAAQAVASSAQKLSLDARAGAKSRTKSRQIGAATILPIFLGVAVVAVAVGTTGDDDDGDSASD